MNEGKRKRFQEDEISYQKITRRTGGSAFVVVDDVFANVALVALTATAPTGALLVTAAHFGRTPNFCCRHAARSTDALTALVAHYQRLLKIEWNITDIC
jgi:hypothetical protein